MSETIFDYNAAAVKAGVTQDVLTQIIKDVQAEFPFDEMLKELHIIRAINYYASKANMAAS